MSPDTTPPDDDRTADSGATVPHALQEGLALALAAEDGGDWKAVADWLARNPQYAADLAEFLAAQRGIRPALAPLRLPKAVAPRSAGGLELREVIGRGGMGVVYRAFDPLLKCERAVKLLHTSGDLTADELARFRIEAERQASLDPTNEHVVPVLSSGEADGMPYLVMPLMPGGSLAEWLRALGPDRQLKPEHAAEIARAIALGVHHAHQRGLIHRDLKPGNILRDERGRPRVADFGLARPADLTATRFAGTVAYMAPEQAGTGKRLTTAVDVYAVGAILFELLAGGPPFGGGDFALVVRRVTDEPAPAVLAYRPDVPPDLAAICAKCLEKRPDDRYPSAAAVAEDLQRFLDGEPIGGRRPAVLTDLARAFGFRRELPSLGSWPVAFMGTFNTGVALASIQAALLLDAPRWVAWAALAFYHVTWVLLVCLYVIVRRHSLNPFERMSGVFHLAMMLAAAACLPTQLWLHHGDVAPVFPPMLAVIGAVMFAQGATFWGRMYLVGAVMLAAVALMPLVPVVFWPGVYGGIMTVFQFWLGFDLRRLHHEGKATTADPAS